MLGYVKHYVGWIVGLFVLAGIFQFIHQTNHQPSVTCVHVYPGSYTTTLYETISTYVPSKHKVYVFSDGTRVQFNLPAITGPGAYYGKWRNTEESYEGTYDLVVTQDSPTGCYYYWMHFYTSDGAWVMTGHLADGGGDYFTGYFTNTNGNYVNTSVVPRQGP